MEYDTAFRVVGSMAVHGMIVTRCKAAGLDLEATKRVWENLDSYLLPQSISSAWNYVEILDRFIEGEVEYGT
jgi:hypothetical protein